MAQEKDKNGKCIFMHNNAPSNTAMGSAEYLANRWFKTDRL